MLITLTVLSALVSLGLLMLILLINLDLERSEKDGGPTASGVSVTILCILFIMIEIYLAAELIKNAL